MTVKNEFQPFATGIGALVKTPDEYQSLAERLTGFTNGVADPAKVNTTIRQPASVAAAMGYIVTQFARQSALDNGDIVTLANNILLALRNQTGNINAPLSPWPVLVKSRSVFAPPANPEVGDCYVVPTGATGDWDGLDEYVAEWDGVVWRSRDYPLGICVFVQDEADILRRITGGWRTLEATGAEVTAGAAHDLVITPYNLAQLLQTTVPGVYEGDYPPAPSSVAPGSTWTESDTALGYELILSGGVRHWVEHII